MPRYARQHRNHLFVWLGLVLFLTALLAACSEEATTPEPTEPRVPDLTAGMWNAFSGNNETECSDGSEYEYYVYPGTENKLVIDFQGGGACWDDGTCSLPSKQPNDGGVYNSVIFGEPAAQGIYDKAEEDNPTKDWYHAFVSYCTADIHLGDSTQTYMNSDGTERTVQHKGQVNAQAVLDWVYEEFEAPETILMTGCSAGAYGSIAYMPQVRKQYPNSDIYQLGDSGAGVAPQMFFEGEDGTSRWNAQSVLSTLIPELDLSGGLTPSFLTDIYALAGEQNQNGIVSQYNSAFDNIQILFYALQQGATLPLSPEAAQQAAQEWTAGLNASLAGLNESTDNFYSYTSLLDNDDDPQNGTEHCIITKPDLYEYELNGVPFVSWVDDLVNGRTDDLASVAPSTPGMTALK